MTCPRMSGWGMLRDYVEARLLEGEASPYLGRADLARAAARHVADAAYPNYLVARLITEDLLSRATPAPEASVPRPHFPSTVAGAFEGYLSRFGEDQPAVRDLLLPLAFAEGEGLPWDNIWAPVATALSGREYRMPTSAGCWKRRAHSFWKSRITAGPFTGCITRPLPMRCERRSGSERYMRLFATP